MKCLESVEVTYYHGNDLRPTMGIIVNVRKSMVRILHINNSSTYKRHANEMQFQKPSESVPNSVVNFNTNEYILAHTESTSNTQSAKHTINLRSTIDHKNWDSHLCRGGFGTCTN
ncbi:unnamed protein product [Schistosoma curassoni]|uniref:Uncharacterized protein n=1 Tax=Schistosoma curassoni TaxID=6186 RepID=A0A183JZR4_9TREM|nr:unnamed protein product [Schistosoma curassoni]